MRRYGRRVLTARHDDLRLDFGGDLAGAVLARDGGCRVFGGGFEFVRASISLRSGVPWQ